MADETCWPDPARPGVPMEPGRSNRYLICKYGGFYRPNSAGYTMKKADAGRYTLEQAMRITHPNGINGPRDGMSYIHEDDVPEDTNGLTPAEVAAREAAATAAGFIVGRDAAAEAAWRYTPRGHEGDDGAYNRGINTGVMHARSDIESRIRALTPPADQSDALAAMLRAAETRGMMRAAEIAEARHKLWHMPYPDDARPFEVCDDVSACRDIAAAIRAAAEGCSNV